MKRLGLCLVDDDGKVVDSEIMRVQWVPSGEIRIDVVSLGDIGTKARTACLSALAEEVTRGDIVKRTLERLMVRQMEEDKK